MTIYGRQIALCDADPFTRSFTATRGVPQHEAIPYPMQPIEAYRAEKSTPSGAGGRACTGGG